MLPDRISSDTYSLNGSRKHLGMTVEFDVDNQGNIVHTRHYESLLHLQKCYNYEAFTSDALDHESQNYQQIRGLYAVTNLLNSNR